jgi:hypothetical protein
MSMRNPNDPIGNGTSDLPPCSAVCSVVYCVRRTAQIPVLSVAATWMLLWESSDWQKYFTFPINKNGIVVKLLRVLGTRYAYVKCMPNRKVVFIRLTVFFYVPTNFNEWICTVVPDEINPILFRFDASPTLHDIKLAFIILKPVIIRNQYTIWLIRRNNKHSIHFKIFDLGDIYG